MTPSTTKRIRSRGSHRNVSSGRRNLISQFCDDGDDEMEDDAVDIDMNVANKNNRMFIICI